MKLVTTGLLVMALMGATACSKNGNGLFGSGGSDDVSGLNGGAGGTIDERSISFFNQSIGDTVLFPVDQSTLTPEALAILNGPASWLNHSRCREGPARRVVRTTRGSCT